MLLLLFSGLLTAIVIYPFLHETGHAAAALLFGGNVTDFRLFPQASILCDITKLEKGGLAAIGFCGMLFPLVLSFILHPHRFTTWYILLLIKGISFLAFAISFVSILGLGCGIGTATDDIVILLKILPDAKPFCIAAILSLMLISIHGIVRQHPFKHLNNFLFSKQK